MLFLQRTALRFDGMVNSLLITKPILLLPFTKVICFDEENRFYVTTYKKSKEFNCQIKSRLWFSFESKKLISNECEEENCISKIFHITLPMFNRIAYDTCSSNVGPTFDRLGNMEDILKRS